jgi:glucose-1-phosphate thymidylyltransferase
VLAGGTGSRLGALTAAVNKHLLPLGRQPMVCRAVEALVQAGIAEVMVTTAVEHACAFGRLFGDGHELGAERLEVAWQSRPGGIAEALGLAEEFAARGPVAVLLADNVFEGSLAPAVAAFERQRRGARVVLSPTQDWTVLTQVGVPVLERGGARVLRIEEKPTIPPSCFVATGAYLFDEQVWDLLPTLERSARGELEITDVLNRYAAAGALEHDIIEGFWTDAGQSVEAYYAACDFVRRLEGA